MREGGRASPLALPAGRTVLSITFGVRSCRWQECLWRNQELAALHVEVDLDCAAGRLDLTGDLSEQRVMAPDFSARQGSGPNGVH